MAEIKKSSKVRLFVGVLYRCLADYEKVVEVLSEEFGESSGVSEDYEFNFTNYYEEEMGSGLKKRLVMFGILDQEKISSIKILTNEIEKEFSQNGKRVINLDPGFIGFKQVVLASAKESPYRIYIKDGIYGQIVLVLSKYGCIEVAHTFPDFRQKNIQEFLVKHAPVV